ncbi:MAG: TetR family transcriptional regulator [Alphaproteobacteria bacterium]|nr:TetR family transcriptional regulator [Alphaproteobacteria bacterium]MBV9554207.1 TetR family transcriptional regulator [Alphaproteobacteria bacterium]
MAATRRRAAARGSSRAGLPERDRIIAAAMALIAARGWRSVSLAAVAAEAGLSVLQVYRHYRSPRAILCGLIRHTDEIVLAQPALAEPGERPRDRIFDLLMRRFDALSAYRPALASLRRDLPFDPLSALGAGGALLCSMRLTLEAAGIRTRGLTGAVAVKLTAAAYIAAMQTWASDDSPDLAPTMAALDRRLRNIERCLPVGRTPPPAEESQALA